MRGSVNAWSMNACMPLRHMECRGDHMFGRGPAGSLLWSLGCCLIHVCLPSQPFLPSLDIQHALSCYYKHHFLKLMSIDC